MILNAHITPGGHVPPRRWITTAVSAMIAMVMAMTAVLFTGAPAQAANPIVTDRFVADPSAHVFNGRMYVYATHDSDNSGTYWDSKDWRAYSTADGVNWTDHGQVFSLSGFSWATRLAWAPAAAQRNGYYYLYLPVDRTKIGVARSTSPTSGFSDVRGTPLIDTARDANTGVEPIDPMTFIDDDGQAYLYFGSSRQPKVVRLNSDMMSTSGPIMNVTVNGAPGQGFAEAPWMHKRNGLYYFSFSTGWPGQIQYATATNPLGPFTYRGVAIDYVNVNTNHASLLEFNNKWYAVYHKKALEGGSNHRRSIVADYLHYNADGSIKTVVQTAIGTEGPYGPYEMITGRQSGKAIDVQSGSTADGAPIIQWSPKPLAANQHWFFRSTGDGYYSLVSRNTGKCLDVSRASTADGGNVIQWPCKGTANQQWSVVTVDNYVQLVARHSGKCLEVRSASTADGAAIIQWTCKGSTNQQWTRTAM
ncbi:family 43 glycosylhydrolase [Streptomyces capitiformicae]|uniref:family 43 glycosylhydrolase n=1 Tax=Streptomyces capitiformicae TaxID=2014920 RepID=UPI001AD819D3|nr:RICIN domain-containing protein [Streptomyces capitiformicae]